MSSPSAEVVSSMKPSFLLSERVSVKTLFDNIRNYLICTALFAVALSFGKVIDGKSFTQYSLVINSAHIIIWILAVIATLLNVFQTAAIIGVFFERATDNGVALRSDRIAFRLLKVMLSLGALMAVCFSLLALLLVFATNVVVSAKLVSPL